MSRWTAALLARYDALSEVDQRQLGLVLIAVAIFLLHYVLHSVWFVEDAAITFAFARNFAAGDGFVAYPGGEPVQGFSNPTWTLLIAAAELLGVGAFPAGKLLGAALGAVAVALSWPWARAVLGDRPDLTPALPAVLLALSPQHVAWAASGMESAVVAASLAAGGALVVGEIRRPPRIPWSALAWSVLALSRPEAPALAAIGVSVGLVGTGARHGPRAALDRLWRIGLLAAAPFFAWHAFALLTFAWEAPMTYYAKLGSKEPFDPLRWSGSNSRGWRYLREYALNYGHGFALWLYALGVAGWRGWRGIAACVLIVIVHLALLPGIDWLAGLLGPAPLAGVGALPVWPFAPDGDVTITLRVRALLLAVLALPLIGIGRPGQAGRALAFWLAGFALFFALYAGGDWMRGYRFMATAAVPLAILLVDAAVGLADRVGVGRRWARHLALGVPLGAVALLGVVQGAQLIARPETSPYDVYRRVRYVMGAADRLGLERPVLVDVDMGAHLWWAGGRAEIVDMAGLVDAPVGVHRWQKPFVSEYIHRERRPDFMHAHGSWARRTKVRSVPEWREFVEIPPYPSSRFRVHEGSFVRRTLLHDPAPPPRERAVTFEGGLTLRRWDALAPAQPAGGALPVELSWERRGDGRDGPAQVLVFLSGHGRRVVAAVEPAFGWVPYDQWRLGEVMRSRHPVRLPEDLPEGRYDLGILVLGVDGAALPVHGSVPGAIRGAPALARGEVRWPGVVQIVSPRQAQEIVERAKVEALREGPCDQRWARWREDALHLSPTHPVSRAADAEVRGALATCYADQAVRAASSGSPRVEIVAAIDAGRRVDPGHPELRSVGRAIAARFFERAEPYERAGDLDEAYGLLRDGLRLDPSAAWQRRRAERLRDARLGLDPQATWFGRWLDAATD